MKTGELLRMNFFGKLPVWSRPPVFPLPESDLVGHVDSDDRFILLETRDNGTSYVLCRHGSVWVVTDCVCLV